LRVHRADGQHGVERGRKMMTVAAVIAGGRHQQHVPLGARLDGLREQGLGFADAAQLTAADVDDVRAVFDGLQDRARQVELRAHDQGVLRPVGEDRDKSAAARRRDAFDRAARLSKDDAGNVSAVAGGRSVARISRRQRLDLSKRRAGKARVGSVDGAIQDGNANGWIAARFRPKRVEAQQS
jgi:hypothetical protein